MKKPILSRDLGSMLVEKWGLHPNTTRIEIIMETNTLVVVRTEHYASNEDGYGIVKEMKKYTLQREEEEKENHESGDQGSTPLP